MKILTDTHIHTVRSACCTDERQTAAFVAGLLAERGFRAMAVTDHLWCNPAIPPKGWPARHPLENLLPQIGEIRREKFPIRVFSSCEADMQGPGRIGITPEAARCFDFVSVASDHFQLKYFVDQPEEPTPEKLAPMLLNFFTSAVKSGLAQILLHPLFTNGYVELFDATAALIGDEEYLTALSAAAERNIGLEINCGVIAMAEQGRFSIASMERIFRLAKRAGCTFTFGSDAHRAEDLELYAPAEDFADRVGITADDLHPIIRPYYP